MPTINIYTNRDRVKSLESILPDLREYTAQRLSCRDIALKSTEMSLRVIVPEVSAQIADTELEIMAYNFEEREKEKNNICTSIRDYIQNACPKAGSVYVWLHLGEMGHSPKK